MTLNDLVAITEVKTLTVYAGVSPRLRARIDVDMDNGAELNDIIEMYGEFHVKRISPAFKGDARMVVHLDGLEVD